MITQTPSDAFFPRIQASYLTPSSPSSRPYHPNTDRLNICSPCSVLFFLYPSINSPSPFLLRFFPCPLDIPFLLISHFFCVMFCWEKWIIKFFIWRQVSETFHFDECCYPTCRTRSKQRRFQNIAVLFSQRNCSWIVFTP